MASSHLFMEGVLARIKAEKRKRLIIKVSVALVLFLMLGFILSNAFSVLADTIFFKQTGLGDVKPWQIIGALGGMGVIAGVLSYLQPTQNIDAHSPIRYRGGDIAAAAETSSAIAYLDQRLIKFEQQINLLTSEGGASDLRNSLSDEERDELKQAITEKIKDESQADLIAGIERTISSKWQVKQAEDVFLRTVNRLERELVDQARRGNVNLALGIFTTLTGVGILSYSVFQAPVVQNAMELVSHFLPRLSLVILVEVFAYFFLRLYKQGLAEIKYFQNEITNIESKYLALNVSSSHEVKEGILKAVERLLLTERNFILEKGQSTVDLEKAKSDHANSANLVEKMSQLVSAAKK